LILDMSRSDLKPSISDFNLCIGLLYKKKLTIFFISIYLDVYTESEMSCTLL